MANSGNIPGRSEASESLKPGLTGTPSESSFRPAPRLRQVAVSGCSAPSASLTRPPPLTTPPELGTAETQVAAPVRGHVAAAVRRAHVLRDVEPRAAPDHAVGRRRPGAARRLTRFLFRGVSPNIAHHSHTFPSMSYRPQEFASFPATGWVSLRYYPVPRDRIEIFGYRAPFVPARQAYSHWASEGSDSSRPSKREFNAFTNSWHLSQLTDSTGRSAVPWDDPRALKWLGFPPITADHSAVHGVSKIQNPESIDTR